MLCVVPGRDLPIFVYGEQTERWLPEYWMLHNPSCPTCGSDRTSLVRPGSVREFAYRCFSCGRSWRIFPAYAPAHHSTAMDRPLSKRARTQITTRRNEKKNEKKGRPAKSTKGD